MQISILREKILRQVLVWGAVVIVESIKKEKGYCSKDGGYGELTSAIFVE